jgi:Flp pilus assembly pilin Flp
MPDALWFRLREAVDRLHREERGDTLINWVVLAVGLAAAAAAVVAVLRPAIQDAAQKIVNLIGG